MKPSVRKVILSWVSKAILSKAMFGLILFVSAGTMKWPMAWVYLAIYLLFDIATALLVAPRHPELLIERTKLGANTKAWDKILVRLAAGYGPFAIWIVSGLQYRYGWLPEIPLPWQWIAAGITAIGFAIVAWAMWANAFFAVTARLQPERGQTVASGGPYAIIRHPGYLGAAIFNLATAAMLGSAWGLIPGVITVGLFVLRTSLEDRMLQAELAGYREYTQQTRWRLLPGVW
jgi:protein-S-isoprenylcysteine O-methyltransferase Ste14